MGFFSWLKGILFGGMPQRKPQIVRPVAPSGPPPRPVAATPLPPQKPAAPVPRKTAGYTSEEFAPISANELRDRSKSSEVATSPWWGRIDTIPPGDDERTKLIDRALVTRGYLTPEQLVEIHRVGDLMLLKKGDQAGLRAAGDRAVAQTKEERAVLKAEKKRQAEERKRAHAEAVARRKATDIIFL